MLLQIFWCFPNFAEVIARCYKYSSLFFGTTKLFSVYFCVACVDVKHFVHSNYINIKDNSTFVF